VGGAAVKKVLVAEDDRMVREIIVMVFEDFGWSVREAVSGDEALDLLDEGELDLLFTDIRMPGRTSGWDLAEKARITHPHLPIVYCSGYSAEAHRLVERSVYVQKPCRTSTILRALQDLGLSGP
jgi:CheY-like chemotaxis protein